MPKSKRGESSRGGDKQLSTRTKKQIDSLPEHAQHIYKKAHASAIDQYQNPEKRRGGKKQSILPTDFTVLNAFEVIGKSEGAWKHILEQKQDLDKILGK
jgi:hypothetical protein